MRRSATVVLIAVCGAAVLLIVAAGNSQAPAESGVSTPAQVAGGFAALIALTVFAAAIAEYLIHGRKGFLSVAVGFLAAGLFDAWYAAFPASSPGDAGAVWYAGRLTLAVMLIQGAFSARAVTARQSIRSRTAIYLTGVVLWVAVVIFSVTEFPVVSLAPGSALELGLAIASAVLFAFAWFVYSRPGIQRNSTLIAWIGYGLVFAAFGQLAAVFSATAKNGAQGELLFALANLMKLLGYLTPVAGLVAEHARLRGCIQGQSADLAAIAELQRLIVSTTSPGRLYQQMVEMIAGFLKLDAVCLMPYDHTRNLIQVAACAGLEDEVSESLVFRTGDGPVGEAASSQETRFVPDAAASESLAVKLGSAAAGRSAVCIPLVVSTEYGDSVVGVLMALFKRVPPAAQKERLRMLKLFAAQAALAVERAQKGGRINESLSERDARIHQLDIVREIGQAITSELTLDSLVDRLGTELSRALAAQACSVLIFDKDSDRMKILGLNRPSREHSVAEHFDACDAAALEVAETGRLRVLNDVPNSAHCKYPPLLGAEGGVHHLLSVPMSLRGRTVGAINVFRTGGDPWNETEARLLEMLSKFVAAGVQNARIYERQRSIATSLQEDLMAGLDREFRGIEVSACYRPAWQEAAVGGDFFDLIELGDGRYAVAIGDVSGKGLDAASYMGMAKHMIKAYSDDDPDPVSVVTRLNSALCAHTPTGRFITLVYGVVDVNAGEFVYVNAGHELPFHYREKGGELLPLGSTGVAAGALQDAEYAAERVPFEKGDILVLYTDGATDARGEEGFLNTEGLHAMVERHIKQGCRNLPEALYEEVRKYAGDRLTDDVAILCVKSVVPTPGQLF